MLKSSIHVDMRNEVGSNACHRIRDHGHVPGILYGHNITSKTVEVDRKELDGILRNYGSNMLLDLDVKGDSSTVLIKDVQRHPVSNEIIHVDFQMISEDEAIHAVVPIILRGRERVESKSSVIQQQLRELHIECLPKNMPEHIELDISTLAPSHPLRIADIEFAQEITILNDPSEVIASLAKAERVIDDIEEEKNVLDKMMAIPSMEK